MAEYIFEIPDEEITVLAQKLKIFEKWENKYECDDDIDDGYGWNIMCLYKDISINTEGYESYPDDYWEKISMLQEEIENLCKKYADNYSEDGLEERLAL